MISTTNTSTSKKKFGWLIGILILFSTNIRAQNNPNCIDSSATQKYTATAFLNYGSASDLFNSDLKAAVTIGQTATKLNMYSSNYKSELGFWGQFLLPPLAPYVQASEGNLGDRVEVTWTVSKLSPVVTDVFKVYRNGTFLDEVENDERVYVDYNVVAGEFYTYTVRGVNKAGIGKPGSSVGFLNPNGTITGQIKTISGNPVIDCSIDLSPTLGTSLLFNEDGIGFAEYNPLFDTSRFTVSFWVKQDQLNDQAGLIDLGSSLDKNWWIHTPSASTGKGVVVKLGGNSDSLSYVFPVMEENDWHHIAATFSGTNLLLYVNGELKGSKSMSFESDSSRIYFGGKTESAGYFKGNLDEILIFNRQLTQTDIQRNVNKSISSKTEGLIAYWKMDEGKGSKTYDLTQNENRMYLCGPQWSSKKAPITNSSLSDENGYYIIEGINYGTGQTFTVKPSKKIYKDVSLEFNASDEKWAELTNFDLPDSSGISIAFNVFDLTGTQMILSKGEHASLYIDNGSLNLDVNGTILVLENLDIGWHHVFLNINQSGNNADIEYYRNGAFKSSNQVSISESDWSLDGINWTLAAESPMNPDYYFTGLIDEVIFYKEALKTSDIQLINGLGTDLSDARIFSSFSINEAQGDTLIDLSIDGGKGVIHGAGWANASRLNETFDHEFLPSSKFVTLNKTNTSTDQVDFVDLSTIPISGYVRYKNTSCFADSVEILIDGYPASPPIFTNTDGYFVVELEPGSSAKLSPKYHGHSFSPAFFEVLTATAPIAGVLFIDNTTRKVSGQLAGGNCRKSIIPNMGSATVAIMSDDGCFEKEVDITASNGKYTVTDVPPFKCSVAITDHSNSVIKDAFNIQGGSSIDLTFKNDTVDFIYYSPPVVTLSDFGEVICDEVVIKQNQTYSTNVQLHEVYDGGTCPIDSAFITVYDGFNQEETQVESFMIANNHKLTFTAGPPNIAAPYRKNYQVEAMVNGYTSDAIKEAIILGRRPRNVNFTSTSPSLPFMILHDPPGDQSYSFIEKGKSFCTNFSMGLNLSTEISTGLEVSLGPDIDIIVGTPFAAKINTVDVVANFEAMATLTTNTSITNSGEFCTEALTKYTTDQDEYLVGDTSDVYIGGALNMLFGVTDILTIDTSESYCFVLDTGVNVMPGNFATNFYYSEYQIQKNIIPNLYTIGDTASAQQWENIIEYNQLSKSYGIFKENISFGSGVNIEKSFTERSVDKLDIAFDISLTTSVAAELGVLVDGVGATAKLSTSIGIGGNIENGETEIKETTFGFRLGDNDPGDIFTVNVLKDPIYGSPMFKTVSGASSCPYEENTVPRDELTLVVDYSVLNNILENDAATFVFTLGNVSQTAELRNYEFSLRAASNVNGAQVKINGTDPVATEFQIPPFESIPVTVTVERGTSSYTDTLIFDFVAACEEDRFIALGIPKSTTPFTKSQQIIVNFVKPCSSIDINSPQQDWVIIPEDGPFLAINLFDYDVNDTDLDLIRVQYRRSQGNGAWINITDIPKDSLGILFENLDWDTEGLEDGLYEIRALAVCTGGIDVGISHVIKGKIERTPPELFGTAEPADGVLSKGDEISITFNEPIQCESIIQAAGIGANIQNNNLGLYDTETGQLIDYTLSCSMDKIILVPKVSNIFLENKLLRVELDSILDLVGNKSGHFEWEFLVDKNSLSWLDRENVLVVKYEEDFVHEERRIENKGGLIMDWELQNIPDYCTIYPTAGQLNPGDVTVINFEFDEGMAFGKQLDTIQLHGPEGDEPMIIDARVVCPPPNWEINPADWENGMNFTIELNIEGEISHDEEDVIGAFINDELRGVGHVKYYEAIDKYLVFMTVYSDIDSVLVDMRVWDASSCILFSPVVETFWFVSDKIEGTPLNPQLVHTNNLVLKEIEVHPGWNWLSFNLELLEPSPDSLLQTINNPENGIIKDHIAYSQYSAGFGWFGALDSIGNTSSYLLRVNEVDTIIMRGHLIDPDSMPIPISVGWNYIGYIPRGPMSTNQALAGLEVLSGDVIKSQTHFAQYVAGFGWIGTLANLKPDEGYKLKTSIQDTLLYPNVDFNVKGEELEESNNKMNTIWEVNPFDYEHSMTITGMIKGEDNITEAGWTLGAFVDGKCRGVAQSIYVEPLDVYMFFITTFANASGELMEFKLFDGVEELDLVDQMYFAIDAQIGKIEDPYAFTLMTTGTSNLNDFKEEFIIRPNPVYAGNDAMVSIDFVQDAKVFIEVYDQTGKQLLRQESLANGSKREVTISTSSFESGTYTALFVYGDQVISKKLIVIK